jgi:hypothetical protein
MFAFGNSTPFEAELKHYSSIIPWVVPFSHVAKSEFTCLEGGTFLILFFLVYIVKCFYLSFYTIFLLVLPFLPQASHTATSKMCGDNQSFQGLW